MTGVTNGNQEKTGDQVTDPGDQTVHGAPSGKGPSDILKKALSSAALATSETNWTWYNEKLTCLQLVEHAIGASPRCTAMSQMNFIGADGRPIGISLKALSSSWGIYQHPDAPREEGLEGIRFHGKGTWRWSRFRRQLDFALNGVQGTTSPLRLLAYSLFLPRAIVGELRDLVAQHILTTDSNGKQCLKQEAELFAWKQIVEPPTDLEDSSKFLVEVKNAYVKWTSTCTDFCTKVEKMMDELECSGEASHPIVILRRWASMYRKAGRLEFSRIVEEEVYLVGKLSGASGLQIGWPLRAALYELILQQCPRAKMSDSGYGALIAAMKSECKTPQEVLSRLQTQALNNGQQTIDGYLGLISPEDHGKKRVMKTNDEGWPSKKPRVSYEGSSTKPMRPFNDRVRLPPAEVAERQKNGLCFKCGQKGHLAKNCPKLSSSNSSSSRTNNSKNDIHITNASSAYPISVESSSNKLGKVPSDGERKDLSIVTGIVSNGMDSDHFTPLRIGIDSMSSVNLISDQLVKQTALRPENRKQPLLVKGLNGEVELDFSCDAYVTLRGYTAKLGCMICPSSHLPGSIDLLVGRPSFRDFNIELSLPDPIEEYKSIDGTTGIYRPLRDMERDAMLVLMSYRDSEFSLPGATEYTALLRKIRDDEVKDCPEQKLVYDVQWTDHSSHEGEKIKEENLKSPPIVYDYSTPLLQKMTPEQRAQFRTEINQYKKHQWWEEVDSDVDETSIGVACTFPVAQSVHKTTRTRPCTDCRMMNKSLPSASYQGFTIFEATALIRARWQSSYTLAFLDLSKAFYRLRLGKGKHVHIVTDNHRYRSNRVVFGLVFGPAALSGLVLTLLNAAFSGLLGRPVKCHSTKDFIDLVPELYCVAYYDDIMIWGNDELVEKLAKILEKIAPLVGSEFPNTKQDWLKPREQESHESCSEGFRHLGCIWVRDHRISGDLQIRCLAPSMNDISIKNQITRRELFKIAGMLYDPMRLHPLTRFVADRIRRWGGKSEGGNTPMGWDRKWVIDTQTQSNLKEMIKLAYSDHYGQCHHIPVSEANEIVGYCDASEEGWGLLLYAHMNKDNDKGQTESNISVFSDSGLLEAHCGEWDDKSRKYHINRREAITVQKTMYKILGWLRAFPQGMIKNVTRYCDNSTAVSWSMNKLSSGIHRSYDRIALERLTTALHEVKDYISSTYEINADIKHIKGLHNTFADKLSRSSSSILPLKDLNSQTEGSKSKKGTSNRRHEKVSHGAIVLVVTDSGECALINDKGSSHRGAMGNVGSPVSFNPICEVTSTNVSEIVLDVDASQASHPEDEEYTTLVGIGSLTKDDILDHIRKALQDDSFTNRHPVIPGVTYHDLLTALKPESRNKASIKARALAQGSPNGQYFKLQDGLLWVNDPQEKSPAVDYRVVLPTLRSQKWALYRAHDCPLASHRSAYRATQWIRNDIPGYWWPNQVGDISKHIRACQICQLNKFHDVQNNQPVIRRRWQSRFETIQLDWAGPFSPDKQNDKHPLLSESDPAYLCVIVCEGTHMLMAIPTPSTSARCLIFALTSWIALYGPPSYVQLDNAGGHKNAELLDPFFKYWGITAKFGLPRHPQSQGLVERAIRDLKTAVRIGLDQNNTGGATIPWWLSIQVAVIVHNTAIISDIALCSPMELSLGSEDRLQKFFVESEPTASSTWSAVNQQVADLYGYFQISRSEKAMISEMRSIADMIPRHRFKPGDQVKMTRIIDNKRQIQGPFEIEKASENNSLIYYLHGKKEPVPLSHLLPFVNVGDRVPYDDAVKPAVDQLAYAAKGKAPWGEEVDLATDKHWLIYSELKQESDSLEPITRIFVAQFIKFTDNGNLLVQGLDMASTGAFRKPPRNVVKKTQHIIGRSVVVGGKVFKPTRGGRLPSEVKEWLQHTGVVF